MGARSSLPDLRGGVILNISSPILFFLPGFILGAPNAVGGTPFSYTWYASRIRCVLFFHNLPMWFARMTAFNFSPLSVGDDF